MSPAHSTNGVAGDASRTYAPTIEATIRVDTETHARLVELSESTGSSLMATVRDAAEALRRQRFADQVTSELEELRTDPAAWSSNLGQGDATSGRDGVA